MTTLTPSWLATTRALAVQTGGRLILDLDLKLDSAAEMVAEANAFRTGIGTGNIDALEIGNEPELYAIIAVLLPQAEQHAGLSPAAQLQPCRIPPRDGEVRQAAPAASRSPGRPPGTTCGSTRLPKLFTAEPTLKVVTYHRYPLIRCFTKPGDPGYPSIPNLLAEARSRAVC